MFRFLRGRRTRTGLFCFAIRSFDCSAVRFGGSRSWGVRVGLRVSSRRVGIYEVFVRFTA